MIIQDNTREMHSESGDTCRHTDGRKRFNEQGFNSLSRSTNDSHLNLAFVAVSGNLKGK